VFFANRGMFRRGDIEEIMNKASCLSLLSNTVACWNCIHIDKIVKQLKKEGHVIKDETLEAIYPLFFEHVIVNGEYDFF
jgi:TnpA family transposase